MTNTNILIGSCRIKRPRAHFPADLQKATTLIHGHAHYPDEIIQLLRYIQGDIDIPVELLPLVFDDVNNGEIKSLDEFYAWREQSAAEWKQARRVLIEISSLKYLPFDDHYFANLTAYPHLRDNKRTSTFVDMEAALAATARVRTHQKYSAESFIEKMQELESLLADREVIYIAHYQFTDSKTGLPIKERILIRDWLQSFAASAGREFWDPSTFAAESANPALLYRDSSHYAPEGESTMAAHFSRRLQSSQTQSTQTQTQSNPT